MLLPEIQAKQLKQHLDTTFCCMTAVLSFLLYTSDMRAQAQGTGEIARPRNIKILEEYKDKDGNTIRTVQYDQGTQRIKETLIIKNTLNVRVPINPDTINKDLVTVTVSKSRYVVDLYYRNRLIRSYKAVFGPKPLENKCMAGDRCTPEGWFTIQSKNPNSKYNKFLLLNYPNDTAVARFNQMKAAGRIPANAQIGGNVGIHGVWKGGDDMIETGVSWTDGCIAIRNKDVEELYNFVSVGTKVLIRK